MLRLFGTDLGPHIELVRQHPAERLWQLRSYLLRTAPLIQLNIPAGAIFQASEKQHKSA
jgi:hypothetical protein